MKNNKALFLSLVSLIGFTFGCSNVNTKAPEDVKDANVVGGLPEDFTGTDFSSCEIAYRMDKEITRSINTFEASLRIPTTYSTFGAVFSSYSSDNARTAYQNNFISYEVTANGYFQVRWAGVTATFKGANIRTNKWVHVTVTRDTSTQFSLYLDGVYKESVTVGNTKDITENTFRFVIGKTTVDTDNDNFRGEIGSITCYRDLRTSTEILDDYVNVMNINYKNRGLDLLFHTLIPLGEDVLKDTSNNCNNARIMTCDYYYDAEHYAIEEGSYSFGIVGDTQELSRFHPEGIDDYSYWAIENKERTNLQAMLYMGDLSDGMSSSTEEEFNAMFENAAKGMKIMDGKVPYAFVPGNHDYKADSNYRDLTMYNKHFPYEDYAKFDYFGGAYEEGQTQNTFYLFEASGIKYIAIALEFGPEKAVMEWVDEVLDLYSDHRAIIFTHAFLSQDGDVIRAEDYLSPTWYFSRKGYAATDPDVMWNDYLSYHDNVFMILCGHTATEFIAYEQLDGRYGNKTMVFRIDPSYILRGNSGNGFDPLLALFNINEATSTLSINMFSLEKNLLYNTQNQMRINFSDYTRYTHSYYNFGEEVKASL